MGESRQVFSLACASRTASWRFANYHGPSNACAKCPRYNALPIKPLWRLERVESHGVKNGASPPLAGYPLPNVWGKLPACAFAPCRAGRQRHDPVLLWCSYASNEATGHTFNSRFLRFTVQRAHRLSCDAPAPGAVAGAVKAACILLSLLPTTTRSPVQ